MPHKHKRKRADDAVNFDLPPSAHAKALPVAVKKLLEAESRPTKPKQSRPPHAKNSDDIPKTFARLISHQTGHKPRAGLDDGQTKKPKKRRKQEGTDTANSPPGTNPTTTQQPNQPQIQPGERLADFALRVDQSLPLTLSKRTSNTSNKSPTGIPGLQERKTKHNRRLLRMQSEWRQTEKKLRERQEEANEDRADQIEEEDLLWDPVRAAIRRKKGKRKGSGDNAEYDDPWAVLEKKRQDTKQKGITDVVTAPPQLKVVKPLFRRGGGE